MTTLENYFHNQLRSHQCQLPPSDDLEILKRTKKGQSCLLVSDKSLLSYVKFGSLSAIRNEQLRQLRMTTAPIVHPYSEFCRMWHVFMVLQNFLCFFLFPFYSAFLGPFYAKLVKLRGWDFTTFYIFLALMFVVQVFCFVEIAVNFMMGYSTDKAVIDHSEIVKRYVRSYFITDLLSCIPYDLILICLWGLNSYCTLCRMATIFSNVLPLLKLARVKTFMSDFCTIFDFVPYSYTTYNLAIAIVFYVLLIHWCACLWMLLPRWQFDERLIEKPSSDCNESWAMNAKLQYHDVFYQYFISLYRALTCFDNIGFSMTCLVGLADLLLSLVIGVIGKLYKIFLIVVFVQMLSTIMTGRLLYLEIMDQVKEFMRAKKLPKKMREKIMANYMYLYQKEYIGEHKILQLLSDSLRREILLRMHENLIKKVHVFSEMSQNFILDVVSCMKPEIYLAGDVVYKAGESGNCMYFVAFGTVAIYSDEDVEIGHLEDGSHFGEKSLMFNRKRMATMVATEDTELYRLDGADFQELMKTYPDAYVKIKNSATSDSAILRNSDRSDRDHK